MQSNTTAVQRTALKLFKPPGWYWCTSTDVHLVHIHGGNKMSKLSGWTLHTRAARQFPYVVLLTLCLSGLDVFAHFYLHSNRRSTPASVLSPNNRLRARAALQYESLYAVLCKGTKMFVSVAWKGGFAADKDGQWLRRPDCGSVPSPCDSTPSIAALQMTIASTSTRRYQQLRLNHESSVYCGTVELHDNTHRSGYAVCSRLFAVLSLFLLCVKDGTTCQCICFNCTDFHFNL